MSCPLYQLLRLGMTFWGGTELCAHYFLLRERNAGHVSHLGPVHQCIVCRIESYGRIRRLLRGGFSANERIQCTVHDSKHSPAILPRLRSSPFVKTDIPCIVHTCFVHIETLCTYLFVCFRCARCQSTNQGVGAQRMETFPSLRHLPRRTLTSKLHLIVWQGLP